MFAIVLLTKENMKKTIFSKNLDLSGKRLKFSEIKFEISIKIILN